MRKIIIGSLIVVALCVASCTAVVVVTVKGAHALHEASIEAAMEISQ